MTPVPENSGTAAAISENTATPSTAPSTTENPQVTAVPSVTGAADSVTPTEAPEVTDIPEATDTPVPTETSAPTETPGPTNTPASTESPESTDAPDSETTGQPEKDDIQTSGQTVTTSKSSKSQNPLLWIAGIAVLAAVGVIIYHFMKRN